MLLRKHQERSWGYLLVDPSTARDAEYGNWGRIERETGSNEKEPNPNPALIHEYGDTLRQIKLMAEEGFSN